jgi:Zn-dependent peptidase ImmA (M78 family)
MWIPTRTENGAVTFDSLLELIDRHGITVSWERMADGFAGAVDLRSRTIFLDRTLDSRPRHAVSVLAHECGHVALLHGCEQTPRGEELADEWAARLLIPPGAYERAERMYGDNVHAIAVELGVTKRLVTAYQRALHALVA